MAAPASAGAWLAAVAVLTGLPDTSRAQDSYRNLTAGGPLRHGVYGRIEVRGDTPPPLIYSRPVLAAEATTPARAQPVYLYVPPGQVRRWKQHCAKWSACQEAVLFVRMDESPSRWGRWRQLREQVALQGDERD